MHSGSQIGPVYRERQADSSEGRDGKARSAWGRAGLLLAAPKSGARRWLYRFTIAGKVSEHGLGSYPAVSLADARDKAAEARKLAKTGKSPVEAKREIKRAKAGRPTFARCADDFLAAKHVEWRNDRRRAPMGRTIFPIVDAGQLALRLSAPAGTRIEETEKLANKTIDIIRAEVAAENVGLGFVGVQNAAYAIDTIYLWTSGPQEAVLQLQLNRDARINVSQLTERLSTENVKAPSHCAPAAQQAGRRDQALVAQRAVSCLQQ